MQNPFVTNGYAGPRYFCDREKETALLTSFLTNENNVALISPRRVGKTEMLHHCFQQEAISAHYHTFIIDIYATTSLRDFVNVFGKTIIDELRAKGRKVCSQRHLMGAMFTSPSRPFYQSVTVMNLPLIPLDKYTAFAQYHFHDNGKTLDGQAVEMLYRRFDGITSYMQRVLNLLFLQTEKGGTCSVDMIEPAINILLDVSSDTYLSLIYQMPEKQRDVFLAIVTEDKAKNVTGGQFIRKNRLPSASSVRSAVNGLLEKDFITNDNGVYQVYDKFFQQWILQHILGRNKDLMV